MRLKPVITSTALLALFPGLGLALGLGSIHVKSTLNTPLNVEIELVDATPEELAGLQPQLASRDTFKRYGIDYPSYLSTLVLRKGKSAEGRDVIQLTSPGPITEPFATLLVEAVYPRGRLVREYSVLLDPQVFANQATTAAPVAAPVVRPAAPAPAPRPPVAAAPAPAPAQAPAPPAGEPGAAERYTVRRGDTLSRIAGSVVGETGVPRHRQAMVAIFQGNTDAFEGNANLLRNGAILQLPTEQTISAIDPAAAQLELSRQNSLWRGDSASAAVAPPVAADPQLKLVPPTAPSLPAAPAAAGVGSPALEARVATLETELADVRRQLDARNTELADTKAALAAAKAGQAAAPSSAPVQVAASSPVAKPVPAESLISALLSDWRVLAGLGVALLGLLVLVIRRRKDAALPGEESFGGRREPVISATSTSAQFEATDVTEHAFIVEESRAPSPAVAPPSAQRTDKAPAPTQAVQPDNDALQEAELYMAYGLFDQAAALLEAGLKREPHRRDVLIKLIDVCFMWGNKDAFLKAAQTLAPKRAEGPVGEWDKVLIMGRQLLPDDPLFQEKPSAPSDAGGMDLNLEGGHNLIDFDVFSEPVIEASAPVATAAAQLPNELDLSVDDPLESTDTLSSELKASIKALPDLDAEIPLVDRTTEINLDELDLANVDFDVAGGALDDSRVLRALNADAVDALAAPVAAVAEEELVQITDGRSLDAATLSEVGTKLDLARAYIDMGDPSGARSILDEVLQEGSAAQCQEAKRMLSAIPG